MEGLPDHIQEVDYREADCGKFQVQFVWDSVIEQAFTKVEDHSTVPPTRYNAIAPDGVHPRESFIHPNIYRVGDIAEAVGVAIVRYAVTEADAEGLGRE